MLAQYKEPSAKDTKDTKERETLPFKCSFALFVSFAESLDSFLKLF